MNSRRYLISEFIRAGLAQRLDVAVTRNPRRAYDRKESPIYWVRIASEQPAQSGNARVERTLVIEIGVLSRAEDAEKDADERMVSMHTAFWAAVQDARKEMGVRNVRESTAEMDAEPVDYDGAVITERFEVSYISNCDDLTSK